jgi:pyridoxamine 5'-phosphate oxidase
VSESGRPLREEDLDPDPLRQFELWFADAAGVVPMPEAMAVATATTAAVPSLRMVLLKGFGPDGFVFFTNYESRKGGELAENPRAALLLHWHALGRQVRVEGSVERVPEAESDAYFSSRPRGSRIGASVSRQSRPIGSRDELEARRDELERELAGAEVPRPDWWGGFRVRPEAWEFWQHRDDRLHDRFRYTRDGDGWRIERLQP